MARFRTEPAHSHDRATRTGVLLVNLGTPEAPTAGALRPYLRQFLSDPRVVEIPRPIWWLILDGIILTTRPRKSAEKYATVWTDEGSPLKFHTERQAKLIKGYLGSQGHDALMVEFAMRYGEPSIPATLERMRAAGCTRILVVPAYPQYAASTTASVMDEVARCMLEWRNLPEIRYVRDFAGDPGYISALAASVREHWARNGEPEKLVMSFHGVPRFSLDKGDPYHCECQKTGRLLAEALGLPKDRYLVTFQSRFGRAEWLQPYTQPSLEAMADQGVGAVDVICPGFVADCLETLEEIAMECRAAFLQHGGKRFHFIPCLNERDDWIRALARICTEHLGNWLALPAESVELRQQRAARARALGATDGDPR